MYRRAARAPKPESRTAVGHEVEGRVPVLLTVTVYLTSLTTMSKSNVSRASRPAVENWPRSRAASNSLRAALHASWALNKAADATTTVVDVRVDGLGR